VAVGVGGYAQCYLPNGAAGFLLSDRHIVPVVNGIKGSPIPCATEQDIFAVLGMVYRAPEERNL